jgi:serine-type D-Ala-D-Ala carboxypeptidase/endopeptidase (penicillin-binding protein 4)
MVFSLACSPTSLKKLSKNLKQSSTFSQHHTGFALYDLAEQKMVFEQNADRYFTPASNTKLLTFYASLKTIGDSIPAIRYVVSGDSLIFWGTGDPSFLHPDLPQSNVYNFLKNRKEKLYFSADNFTGNALGEGWSWDDYNDYYSAEISPLPLYGNTVRFSGNSDNQLVTKPKFFSDKTYNWSNSDKNYTVKRDQHVNLFAVPAQSPKPNFEQEIPYKTSPEYTITLLNDTLRKEVTLINMALPDNAKTIYSLPSDSLYKRMLFVSDNMIAEHLMVVVAGILGKELDVAKGIEQSLAKNMSDSPDKLKWIDGSGLSRYNLFTPRSLVKLLQNLHAEVKQERLFKLLPAAGVSGTLKSLGGATNEPFIFAKSGSLGGVYALSGYLVTKKGKVLIFSTMNNNFIKPTSEIRKEIGNLLRDLHLEY